MSLPLNVAAFIGSPKLTEKSAEAPLLGKVTALEMAGFGPVVSVSLTVTVRVTVAVLPASSVQV